MKNHHPCNHKTHPPCSQAGWVRFQMRPKTYGMDRFIPVKPLFVPQALLFTRRMLIYRRKYIKSNGKEVQLCEI